MNLYTLPISPFPSKKMLISNKYNIIFTVKSLVIGLGIMAFSYLTARFVV